MRGLVSNQIKASTFVITNLQVVIITFLKNHSKLGLWDFWTINVLNKNKKTTKLIDAIQLIKQLPKDMSEIDVQTKQVKPQEVKSEDEEDKKDRKKKKKLEERDEEVSQEDGMTINSEEIGKSTFLSSNHSFNLMMNTLSLPLIF